MDADAALRSALELLQDRTASDEEIPVTPESLQNLLATSAQSNPNLTGLLSFLTNAAVNLSQEVRNLRQRGVSRSRSRTRDQETAGSAQDTQDDQDDDDSVDFGDDADARTQHNPAGQLPGGACAESVPLNALFANHDPALYTSGQVQGMALRYMSYLAGRRSVARDQAMDQMIANRALPRIAKIADGSGSLLLHHVCNQHAKEVFDPVLHAYPRAASILTRAHPAKPAQWTPLHCLCDRQVQKKRENERSIAAMALLLLAEMTKGAIMHRTQQNNSTFLHMLCSRGRWDFLEVVLWPMWGGRFAVTQEEVRTMLDDVNGHGLACYDLCMKNDKRVGYWLKVNFKAEPAKDNPKMHPDFDPEQYAPSGWTGSDWDHWRENVVRPNVRRHDDNRASDWKSNRRNQA